MPITACDVLFHRVLPFPSALGAEVEAMGTGDGRELCGRRSGVSTNHCPRQTRPGPS